MKQTPNILGKAGNWLVSLVVLLVLGGIMAGSIYGLGLPYRFPVVSAGLFEVGVFESGLSLYQFEREGAFYTVTPLNDYLLDSQGYRQPILTWDDLDAGGDEMKPEENKWEQLATVVETYFGKNDPKYMLEYQGMKLEYTSDVNGREVQLTRRIKFDKSRLVDGQGMTLTFGRRDIVFDAESLQVFTEIDREELDWVHRLFGLNLIPFPVGQTVRRSGVKKAVSIINPDVPGILTVEALDGQDVVVDTGYRLIEVVDKELWWTNELVMRMRITSDEKFMEREQ